MKIPFYARIVIVVLIVLAISEISPEVVNAVLLLVLIGLILGRFQYFQGLFKVINSFGGA